MSIIFEKSRENHSARWKVRSKDFKVSYSISSYGRYAKELAELSNKTHIRYKNYIIEKKKYAIMKIFSKKYGECDIKIDKEDIKMIRQYRWVISAGYVSTKINGKRYRLHKMLCNAEIVDHKNRNPFDNRKKNLRPSTHIENNRNRTVPCTNTSGVMGVHKSRNLWVATWVDENGKTKTKSFSENKYNNAFELAVKTRKEKTAHYTKTRIVNISHKI